MKCDTRGLPASGCH